MSKYDERVTMQISVVFGTFSMLTVERRSGAGLFRHFVNDVFRSA